MTTLIGWVKIDATQIIKTWKWTLFRWAGLTRRSIASRGECNFPFWKLKVILSQWCNNCGSVDTKVECFWIRRFLIFNLLILLQRFIRSGCLGRTLAGRLDSTCGQTALQWKIPLGEVDILRIQEQANKLALWLTLETPDCTTSPAQLLLTPFVTWRRRSLPALKVQKEPTKNQILQFSQGEIFGTWFSLIFYSINCDEPFKNWILISTS
jgi:hypothetical protein